MNKYINHKFFLMLGISSLINVASMCAMEKDKREPDSSLGGAVSVAASKGMFSSREAMLATLEYYDKLIQVARVSEPVQCRKNISETLLFLGEFSDRYKANYGSASGVDENRFLAFKIIYNISQRLFGTLMQVGQRLQHDDNKGHLKYAYDLYLKIVESDVLLTDEIRVIPRELLERDGFDCKLSCYNFLNHFMSYLATYVDYLEYSEQIKQFHGYSIQWADACKAAFPLAVNIKGQIDKVIEKMQGRSSALPRAKGGRKAEVMRRQKQFSQKHELIKLVQQSNAAIGSFDASLCFHEFVSLKNLASLDWEKNKSVSQLLEGHRKAYEVLLQLEQGLAKKQNLPSDTQSWNEEDYRAIYVELLNVIIMTELQSRVPEILAISINCNDIRATTLRFNVFAKILGGSTANLESVPHVIRRHFAVFKYLQGEPEFWDMLTQKAEKERQKKREARQRKKGQAIAEEIERAKEVKRELLLRKEKEAQERAAVLEPKGHKKSEPSVPSEVVETIFAKEESMAEIRKRAQEALAREQVKLEKKAEKNHEAVGHEIKETPETPVSATPSVSPVSLPKITTTTRKHYQSLYSLAPSLSTENAIALLEGFGLKTTSAKGSHAKLTLHTGETITDASGRVVWQCPNLEELMTIIPRWDGSDIPFYMVKNLRYILEKIGVNPSLY